MQTLMSMLLSEHAQGQGLGTELLKRLLQVGQDEQLDRITAEMLSDNAGMQRVCEKLGFQISRTTDPSILKAEI